jgi:hypothetical protein
VFTEPHLPLVFCFILEVRRKTSPKAVPPSDSIPARSGGSLMCRRYSQSRSSAFPAPFAKIGPEIVWPQAGRFFEQRTYLRDEWHDGFCPLGFWGADATRLIDFKTRSAPKEFSSPGVKHTKLISKFTDPQASERCCQYHGSSRIWQHGEQHGDFF